MGRYEKRPHVGMFGAAGSLTRPLRSSDGGIAWGDFALPARRSWLGWAGLGTRVGAGAAGTYVGAIPPLGSQGRGAGTGLACG